MIQPGTYEGRPLPGVQLGEASTGTIQVGIEFELYQTGAENSTRMTWYGYFTDKSTERTIETLRLCGWTGDDFEDLSEIGLDESVRVSLVVREEEYNGKSQTKIAFVNRPGGVAMAAPLDGDKRKAFAARMKGQVLAYDQKAGKPAAPATKPVDAAPAPAGEKPPF